MTRNWVNTLPNAIFVQRSDSILVDGYKNIREMKGEMSRILLRESQICFSCNTTGNPESGFVLTTLLVASI